MAKLIRRPVSFMGLGAGNYMMKFMKASLKMVYGPDMADGYIILESITKAIGRILPKWAMVNKCMLMASFKKANGYTMNS